MHNLGATIKQVFPLILAGVVFCLPIGCYGPGKCGETITQSHSSPDGATTATTTVVNCGAMTDFFTFVSIHTSHVKLRDEGMIFGYNGKPELGLSWAGPRELVISCSKCVSAKVYRQVIREGEYQITYKDFDDATHRGN
jgi:hypothetical protein